MTTARPRSPVVFLAAGALLTLLAGCSGPAAQPASPQDSAPAASSFSPLSEVAPREVATGLETPWSIVFVGDTALISERDTGRILELDADGDAREVGVVEGVAHGGEGGLLGLAVDGQQRLYAYSTGSAGNRIQRFPLQGSAGEFELGEATTIVDGLPFNSNHNGGRLGFGPDEMLYAGVGDAGRPSLSQDLDSLGGKILRMTPDGAVPDDNPFPGSLVYSYGHRNVQGLGWAADGTMFASEFGQDTWDELNIIEAGGNYGWPEVEGLGGGDPYVDPVQQWAPVDASPSGLTVVDDTVYIANLRGQVLRAVPVADPGTFRDYYAGEFGRIRAVTPAPDGSLWFVTSNTGGRSEPRPGDDRILAVPLSE